MIRITCLGWPGDPGEPPSESIDRQNFEQMRNITVSGPGLQALAARRAKAQAVQVKIINSIVGQLALRDISNIDVFMILDAAEQALDQSEAPATRGKRLAASFDGCGKQGSP